MVGGNRRNCAYGIFFANQTENYINFNPTSTKIELTSRSVINKINDTVTKFHLSFKNVHLMDIITEINMLNMLQIHMT